MTWTLIALVFWGTYPGGIIIRKIPSEAECLRIAAQIERESWVISTKCEANT